MGALAQAPKHSTSSMVHNPSAELSPTLHPINIIKKCYFLRTYDTLIKYLNQFKKRIIVSIFIVILIKNS